MDELKEFQRILEQYANAYKAFEEMQSKISFIPRKGDQKTGVIGEAYIFKYLIECGYADVEFGNASQQSWDIRYREDAKSKKYETIQVKTVSDYSDGYISHIRPGFDILYLVKLNKNFYPVQILKVTTKGDWPDMKHKAFPKKNFTFKKQKFNTMDVTKELMEKLNMKIT